MKEQFVTYEIGLKLKEIGFNEECMAGYLLQTATLFSDIPHTLDGNIHKNSEGSFTCAPLWQQCLEWFECEHWVDFWAVPILTSNPKQYECFIMYRGKEISCEILDIRFFNSYNEARQTAIEKILTFI
jgi:hypothetical protein